MVVEERATQKDEFLKKNVLPTTISPIKGKAHTNNSNIIASLCLLGPSTTFQMAENVLRFEKRKTSRKISIPYSEKKLRAGIYYNRLRDRNSEKGKIPGLISLKMVRRTGYLKNEKNLKVPLYFPTFKGCIFALGYNFSKREMRNFLKNAGRHFISFAYLNEVLDNTSMTFFRNVIHNPVKNIIKTGKITFDKQFRLSLRILSDVVGESVYGSLDLQLRQSRILEQVHRYEVNEEHSPEFDSMIKCTWYNGTGSDEWIQEMKDHFYSNDDDYNYFDLRIGEQYDVKFLSWLMELIHAGYYSGLGLETPIKHVQKMI